MRNIEFSIGEYYHIYDRGVDKRIVFIDDSDYKRFMALLYICNSTEAVHMYSRKKKEYLDIFNLPRTCTLVNIGGYCLMPNHFHILLKERIENGISKFMQKLMTAYTMYFNIKYERTGSLFENTFKARHASNDVYLKYLFSYIHLNPVKLIEPNWIETGIKDYDTTLAFMNSYYYSSYYDYNTKTRPENIILNMIEFPDYFSSKVELLFSITDFLDQHRGLASVNTDLMPKNTSLP
ncbi:MAG: transposase [bacterium]|nr:transposase [bacterium]